MQQATILVDVVLALPERGVIKTFRLPATATVGDALQAAAADPEFADARFIATFFALGHRPPVGIFGRAVTLEHALVTGDRIEIYRPLVADPKTARRARAARTRG